MKPVELEIIMRDSTRKGMQSVEKNINGMESQMQEVISILKKELVGLQDAFKNALSQGVPNSSDLADIQALKGKIVELEEELKKLKTQAEVPVKPNIDLGKYLTDEVKAMESAEDRVKAIIANIQKDIDSLRNKSLETAATGVVNPKDAAEIKALEAQVRSLTDTLGRYDTVKKESNATPFMQNDPAPKLNNVKMSMQQIARELPALSMGPQMFFLAISNNIPMFTDAVGDARKEYERLTAAGQKATPVWRQLLKSLISWQTMMAAAITLTVVYGKEIGEWFSTFSKEKKGIDVATESLKGFHKAMTDGEKNAQNDLTRLNLLYNAAINSAKGTDERKRAVLELKKEYPNYFGKLDEEAILLGNAKTAYDKLSVSILATAKARAAEETITENSKKVLDLDNQRIGSLVKQTQAQSRLDKEETLLNNLKKNPEGYDFQLEIVDAARKKVKEYGEQAIESAQQIELLNKTNERLAGEINIDDLLDDGPNKKPTGKTPDDYQNELADARIRVQQKIEAMKIALTQEGAAKEKAEARARLDAELARIDAEEKERKEALAKAKKAGLPVSEEQVATVTDQSGKQRKGATDIYIKEFFDIEKKSAEQEKALWNEVNLHFASGLDQRLAEIDHHYDEQVKKAKGNKELIDALNRNRETDKDVETKNTKLDSIDNAEQIELQRQAIATQGLNMDELVEQQRTDILLKYARQRIAILATMTDERSQQEKAQLEATVEGLEKGKKKPKSVKGFFDEKAMNSLIKHYQKLGSSEEEATEKAQEFATTFQGRMQIASEVVGGLKSAFGGLDEGMDKAMDAVGSVVDGFANGGMVGGIAAAAGQVISITAGLIGAKKEMDASMVANYETWMEAMNDLIDKQISLLDQLGGDKFGANIKKTTEDISKQIAASRKLLGEAASAGSSAGSHSYGYRMNRTLKDYKNQLREVGIYTQDWSKMTDDQLVKLREIPDLWAHVPESMRKYIEALAEGKEKMEEFKQTVQDTVLGFDFSDITSMIVDSVTDSSIDNALGTLVENVDGAIATIVKNMLARNMLVGPIQKMVSTLMTSMTKTKIENGQEVTYYDLEAEAAKNFTDGVTSLGSEYKKAYDKLKEQFAAAGIDFDGADKDKTTQQSGRAGAITTVTEETAGKLEGIGNSIQTHIISMDDKMTDISQCAYEAIGVLGKIAENTAYCKYLEQLADDSAYQRREGTKMR